MLFEESTVVPEQFFVSQRRSTVHGERRLLLAVLEEAIDCYCKTCGSGDTRSRNLYREADKWLFSNDRTQCFAFGNICDVLDLDSSSIRHALLAWKADRAGGMVRKLGHRIAPTPRPVAARAAESA